jgi:hypothetical protein
MEPVSYSLQAVLRSALILGLSLTVFAQIPSARDASGLPLPSPRPAFEFRGIRIGDEMKKAERKFLALKVHSLSSKPGLCGADGTSRIETCTDVLDTGEYVFETGSSGKQLRWFNGDQYMEGSEIERAITIGSRTLDAEIAEQEGS